ncbi:trichohyalin-like isoform X6 [Quercus lobata]|uniref:trichohyalin-like isoform X6 n=1 Tax=Quercus lobata TaxID=97700 RepID=UPI0012441FD8|nr:trichohyalin-like isoform X6 [Quercus lobata]
MTHPLIQMAELMTVKLVYLWTSFTYVFPTLADNTFEQCEQRLKLNKLTDAVMTKFESSYPSHTLRPDLRNQIEECICKKLPDLHTPDHPTYALMIRRAIEELNDRKGSTMEAISKFILEGVEDLPWAHASFLSHHLSKLSESGEIIKVSENCYRLPSEKSNSLPKRGLKKKRKKRHYHGSEGDREHNVEEGYLFEKKQMLKEDKQSQNLEIEVNGELSGGQRHRIEDIEDQNRSQELQIEQIGKQRQEKKKINVTDQQQSPEEQRFQVNDEQNLAQGVRDQKSEDEKDEQRSIEEIEEQIHHDGRQIVMTENQDRAQRHQIEEIEDRDELEEQQFQVIEERQADEQHDVFDEQIKQVQQLEVVENHNEAKQNKVESIEEQNQEQKGDMIVEKYPSQVQKNKQQDEVRSQQGQTQRHEIEVIVEEQIGIVEKNKVPGEQIQEQVGDVIQDQCQGKEQQSELIEVQNLPHDHVIEDVGKQIQLQEEILLIEKLIEPQEQKSEVIEEQNEPRTEMRSNMIAPSDMQSSKEPEKHKAIVMTEGSLTSLRLDNDGSRPLSKVKCIELLKRTKKIQEKLMDIIYSKSEWAVSKDDTLKHVMEEQENEILKDPEQWQIEFSDPKRPPGIDEEASLELFLKHKKQLKLCGQLEVPTAWSKPTRTSTEVLTNSEQLENEQQPELGNPGRGLDLDLTTIEAEGDRQEESISKSLNMDSRQLEMEKQLDLGEEHECQISQLQNSIQERPVDLQLTVLEQSCERQQPSQRQQRRKTRSQSSKALESDCVDAKKSECQLPTLGQQQRQLRPRGLRPSVSDSGKMKAPECQDQKPGNRIQERPIELEPSKLDQSGQTLAHTLGQLQRRQLRPRGQQLSNSGQSTALKSQDQQPGNWIQERPIELEPAKLDQSGQTLAQTLGQLQRRQLRPRGQQLSNSGQSTALKSQQIEKRQLDPQGQGVFQNKLSSSQHQHELQQLQHKGQGRPLKSNPDVDTAMGKYPLDDKHHHKQQTPEHQGLGRPHEKMKNEDQTTSVLFPTAHQNGQSRQLCPRDQDASQLKLAVNDTKEKSLSKHQHEQQKPLKRKGRGRPPKLKPDLDMAMGAQQQLKRHKGRGRPPKSKGDEDQNTMALLPIDDQNQYEHQQAGCQGQVKHPTPKAKEDALVQVSIPLDHQDHNELQQHQEHPPKKRGRGRRPNPKPALSTTTMDVLFPSQQQEQPQHKKQGRPPKRKLDVVGAIVEPQTKRSGRGRPPKVG